MGRWGRVDRLPLSHLGFSQLIQLTRKPPFRASSLPHTVFLWEAPGSQAAPGGVGHLVPLPAWGVLHNSSPLSLSAPQICSFLSGPEGCNCPSAEDSSPNALVSCDSPLLLPGHFLFPATCSPGYSPALSGLPQPGAPLPASTHLRLPFHFSHISRDCPSVRDKSSTMGPGQQRHRGQSCTPRDTLSQQQAEIHGDTEAQDSKAD